MHMQYTYTIYKTYKMFKCNYNVIHTKTLEGTQIYCSFTRLLLYLFPTTKLSQGYTRDILVLYLSIENLDVDEKGACLSSSNGNC